MVMIQSVGQKCYRQESPVFMLGANIFVNQDKQCGTASIISHYY